MTTESAKIIKALGGVSEVARLLGKPYHTVYSWIGRGIPSKIVVAHSRLIAKGRRLSGGKDGI